jgi:hypothetical protein
MKRSVQILLLAAYLAPMAAVARQETMEERKLRVTRKYLRERSAISQSDEMVPGITEEDEAVLEAERFKAPESAFKGDTRSDLPQPAPPQRPVPRQQQTRNWMLAADPEFAEFYADPGSVAEKKEEAIQSQLEQRPIDRYVEQSDPYGETQRSSRWFELRDDRGRSDRRGFGLSQPRTRGFRASTAQEGEKGMQSEGFFSFGRQPINDRRTTPDTTADTSQLSLPQGGTYPASREPARLTSPFTVPSSSSRVGTYPSTSRRMERVPEYKSPYQPSQDLRMQPSSQRRETQEPYRRVDPYKQWKERNPAPFDPMGDDAYINEGMPKLNR